MRYTTIIDLSEFPALYRSENIRLLYLHLCLKSGYHDDDRDLIDISIRRLSYQTGITVSAVRNALRRLQDAGLLTRQGPLYQVRKFVLEKPITKRAQSRRQEQQHQARALMEEESRRRAEERQSYEQRAAEYRSHGKTSFMVYYESLLQKAAAGDPSAADLVKFHAKTYEQHASSVQSSNQNQKK